MTTVAVFLDRDGTLIEDTHYVGRLDEVRPIPGAAAALARLTSAGLRLFVVTNQSGVARGFFGMREVDAIHRALARIWSEAGASVEDFLVCPCHPDDRCRYRKPSPRFLRETARRAGIDLERSFMVGDSSADIEAGQRAGVTTVLVRTGKGRETERRLSADREVLHRAEGAVEAPRADESGAAAVARPDHVADSLTEAVDWILDRTRETEPPIGTNA